MFFMTIAFNTEITYNNIVYPKWSHVLGWLSAASSMICIPIYMIYKLVITPGTLKQVFVILIIAFDEFNFLIYITIIFFSD